MALEVSSQTFYFTQISFFFSYSWFRSGVDSRSTVTDGVCGQDTLTRDVFSTLSSLCSRVARSVCMKHVHPHVITCLSVCCFLVLSSSSVSRVSSFSLTSTSSLSRTSTHMLSRSPSIKPNSHPQHEEYCPVATNNPLTYVVFR